MRHHSAQHCGPTFHREAVSSSFARIGRRTASACLLVLNHCENRRQNDQCREGGADEAADNRAAERSGLAAAFAKSGSHRQHAGDAFHGRGGDKRPVKARTEARGTDLRLGGAELLSRENDQNV